MGRGQGGLPRAAVAQKADSLVTHVTLYQIAFVQGDEAAMRRAGRRGPTAGRTSQPCAGPRPAWPPTAGS